MKKLAAGFIGMGLALTPFALAQNQNPTQNMDAGMQRAIQFQHLKDAEDARQAAMEKQHPSVAEPGKNGSSTVTDRGPGSDSSSTADRQTADRTDLRDADRTAESAFRTEPTSAELSRAVAWEHQKDAAAARQAAIESGKSGN